MKKSIYYGPLMMTVACIFFAGGGAAMKMIPWNPLAINGARNLLASMVIGSYLLITRHPLRLNKTVLLGAACMSGVTTLFAIANKMTTAGNAIILQYTAPVWIILLSYLFFGTMPRRLELVTTLLVGGGILCFFFDSLSSGHLAGDLIAILSGIFYAVVFMLNEFESGDALSSIFLGQLACGLTLTPLVTRESRFAPSVLLAVLFLGVVQVGLAYLFFAEGTRYTPSITASLIAGVEPILNPVFVALIFGEVLQPLSLLGGFIVISAILMYNVLRTKQSP